MQIFIMRHGQASAMLPFADQCDDAQRSLTEQGRLEVMLMAKWLLRQSCTFDQILVSPYVRAQQTATIVSDVLRQDVPQRTVDIITPDGAASDVHDYLDGMNMIEPVGRILLVSHMPLVSYLVAEFTVEHETPIFQTAAIAEIDYNEQRMKGHLLRMVAPSDLC